jgi:hypothetical protein
MRTVAVGLWALLCAASAWAQMPSLPVLEKGLRVGIGWNTFIGADAERIGGRLGPSIGVFAAVELLPEIALQPELLYSRRTAVQEIVLGAGGYDLEYDLAYLELGLPLRLRREVAGYTMYGLLGPVLALRLSGKLNRRVGGGTPIGNGGVCHLRRARVVGSGYGIATAAFGAALCGCPSGGGSAAGVRKRIQAALA